MVCFDLSSSQKMLLFSEINNPNNDSFYLKFRKDYDLDDFENVKLAIESISKNHLNLKIKDEGNGDFKQYYDDFEVNIETFEISDDDLDGFIVDYLENPFEDIFDSPLYKWAYLENPFGDIFDSPLYKWAVLKTESSTVLIGVVQHILLDGTSLCSLIPPVIERYI